jgi:uncharacterized protein YndB with AHSA1/START domain
VSDIQTAAADPADEARRADNDAKESEMQATEGGMPTPDGNVSAAGGEIDTAPIRKSVSVPLSQADAFDLFVNQTRSWWPVGSHSIGGERSRGARFEGRVGGRIYETLDDGTEYAWGQILAWEPPERLVCSWDPSIEARTPTEVEVRFVAEAPDRTRLDLEHRGWERLGEPARLGRESYAGAGGWTQVLGEYVRAARPASASSSAASSSTASEGAE